MNGMDGDVEVVSVSGGTLSDHQLQLKLFNFLLNTSVTIPFIWDKFQKFVKHRFKEYFSDQIICSVFERLYNTKVILETVSTNEVIVLSSDEDSGSPKSKTPSVTSKRELPQKCCVPKNNEINIDPVGTVTNGREESDGTNESEELGSVELLDSRPKLIIKSPEELNAKFTCDLTPPPTSDTESASSSSSTVSPSCNPQRFNGSKFKRKSTNSSSSKVRKKRKSHVEKNDLDLYLLRQELFVDKLLEISFPEISKKTNVGGNLTK